jgi:hypothetical protein
MWVGTTYYGSPNGTIFGNASTSVGVGPGVTCFCGAAAAFCLWSVPATAWGCSGPAAVAEAVAGAGTEAVAGFILQAKQRRASSQD